MILSGKTTPVHSPTWSAIAVDFEIPGTLGYGIADPTGPATWLLPPTLNQVTGALLIIKNVSLFTLSLMASDGTAIIGPTTIASLNTGSLVFDGMSWQTLLVSPTQGASAAGITSIISAGGNPPYSLVVSGVAPTAQLVNLIAGAGISITPVNAGATLQFSNIDPGSAVTLESAGGTISLVANGTAPTLEVLGINQGSGVTTTASSTALTFTGTGVNPAPTIATDYTTDANLTITTAQMAPNSTINAVGPWTANRIFTLPTVTALVATYPFLNVGDQYMIFITNTSGFTIGWNATASGWTNKAATGALYNGTNGWLVVSITALGGTPTANVWPAVSFPAVTPIDSTIVITPVSGNGATINARPVVSGGAGLAAVLLYTTDASLTLTPAQCPPGSLIALIGPWSSSHAVTFPALTTYLATYTWLQPGDLFYIQVRNSTAQTSTYTNTLTGWSIFQSTSLASGAIGSITGEILTATTGNLWMA